MTLTVLSVAYPFAPVTPDPPGGAEQVLAQLDRALVDRGHRSIVLAQAGSNVAGELIEVPRPAGEIDGDAWTVAHAHMRRVIDALAPETDLVHLHGFDFDSCLPPPGPPTVVTLHMPLDWYVADVLRSDRPRTWFQPVSADQASRAPARVALLDPIPNGVDLDRYRPNGTKRGYALVLGRVAPEKGFSDALDAARAAGVPAKAAGCVFPYPEHRRYFAQEVAPMLGNDRHWLGPVAGAEKAELLAEARCLLVPSTAPETSSLVAMEALASGTPVIAYRSGALPEVVEDGVTGFVVDDAHGMAEAIGRVGAIDPARCRAEAERRFDVRRTATEYLALYERLTV